MGLVKSLFILRLYIFYTLAPGLVIKIIHTPPLIKGNPNFCVFLLNINSEYCARFGLKKLEQMKIIATAPLIQDKSTFSAF